MKAPHRILQGLHIFSGITSEEAERVLRICRSASFPGGASICLQGDPSDRVFVLLSGAIDIRTDKAGSIHTMKAGECFGEMGVVTKEPRSASAVAEGDCRLLELPEAEFERLMVQHPRIGMVVFRNLADILSKRLKEANSQLAKAGRPGSGISAAAIRELDRPASARPQPGSAFLEDLRSAPKAPPPANAEPTYVDPEGDLGFGGFGAPGDASAPRPAPGSAFLDDYEPRAATQGPPRPDSAPRPRPRPPRKKDQNLEDFFDFPPDPSSP